MNLFCRFSGAAVTVTQILKAIVQGGIDDGNLQKPKRTASENANLWTQSQHALKRTSHLSTVLGLPVSSRSWMLPELQLEHPTQSVRNRT